MQLVDLITHPAFWFIAGLILIILEITTLTFYLLWIGVAALITGAFAFVFASLGMQLLVFSISTLLLLFYTRPLTRRWRKRTPNLQSGVYALIGKEGVVIDEIAEHKNGTIKVGGEIWSASSETAVPSGEKVVITNVSGVTLVVKSMEG